MNADRLRRLVEALQTFAIELGPRGKALWTAADDGEHQRNTVVRRANHRLRASAHRDPGLERSRLGRRVDRLVREAGAKTAAPRHRLTFQQLDEQIQLFFEQLLI